MARQSGWPALFAAAFERSRNAMVLLDDERRHVQVNGAYAELLGVRRSMLLGLPVYEFVADGPVASRGEWQAAIAQEQFAGVAEMVRADGRTVTVQFAGHPETATGRRLVLLVALSTARSGRRLRDDRSTPRRADALSERERQVVELVSQGHDGPEIAAELQISHNTVRTHVHNAMDKLGARSRAHLVAKALSDRAVLTPQITQMHDRGDGGRAPP
jgi:PAS domain S-box-containing protein